MTNLINIAFTALLITNAYPSRTYNNDAFSRQGCYELGVTNSTHYVITSNWVACLEFDTRSGTLKTNIYLATSTNKSWTVTSTYEYVTRTNGLFWDSLHSILDTQKVASSNLVWRMETSTNALVIKDSKIIRIKDFLTRIVDTNRFVIITGCEFID